MTARNIGARNDAIAPNFPQNEQVEMDQTGVVKTWRSELLRVLVAMCVSIPACGYRSWEQARCRTDGSIVPAAARGFGPQYGAKRETPEEGEGTHLRVDGPVEALSDQASERHGNQGGE